MPRWLAFEVCTCRFIEAVLENGKKECILILFNAVLGRLDQEWSEI
jgi:hypothetical protein